jgi:hypothetical protein
MPYSKTFYELVEYKPNRNFLTSNRDKAIEHFNAGGTVRRGPAKIHRGKVYPDGINYWEEFIPDEQKSI